ncbi:DUF2933 domain-containing protein [Pandoraea sp.]|uniref:DUF2933 domain-containing protein n=1 Tax=Pandoraea sp. TaxID=1883445 RepID=UPI00121472A9|nr:DUF2933 domain-containing protein [Pandoraea sp.]TAL55697.1 MAG: DUF2933 domain-containing protein [Pandoraea sp.]TAM14387.1 MAG: DUF2933 domain-containing protein [Pandoraea sp.]
MNCNRKTLINLILLMAAGLAVVYFALPQFHAFIIGAAPILLGLLCPLSMLFMMRGMSSHGATRGEASDVEQVTKSPSQTSQE